MAAQFVPQPSLTEECASHPGSLILFENEDQDTFCEKCLASLDKVQREAAKQINQT